MKVGIIGDTHSKMQRYREICENSTADFTIQLGDFGFAPGYAEIHHFLKDNPKHVWFGGNHEDMRVYYKMPNCLGDFGPIYFNDRYTNIFFVRGGFTIDKIRRTPGLDWFEDEEIDEKYWDSILKEYEALKPKYLITHEPCREISNFIGDPSILEKWGFDPHTFTTKTSKLLQRMLEIHQPKVWLAGHFHMTYRLTFDDYKTKFIGLSELEYYELEL